MTVGEQLKKVILASGKTHYRMWKDSGVDSRTLDRFMSGEQQEIRSSTIDLLCDYLGLELQPKKQSRKTVKTTAKRQRKK